MFSSRSDIPYEKRIEVARFIEDLTASYQAGWYSVISLHGGGSPEAMKMEIWRNYPLGNKVDLVERLLERGILTDGTRKITRNRQPGRCCDAGCQVPGAPQMVALPASRATDAAARAALPSSADAAGAADAADAPASRQSAAKRLRTGRG